MEPHVKYLQSQILTATPEKLVLMLYDAVMRLISQARLDIESEKIEEANENLCRGQAIIAELMSSLDMERGEIAENLYEIYQFVYDKLVEANVEKHVASLDDVQPLIGQLREVWQECFKKNISVGKSTESFTAIK